MMMMMMLFGLSSSSFVVRSSSNRCLSRRNFPLLYYYQCTCFRQQYSSSTPSSYSSSSYSSDRGRGPTLSNPSVASVLALRPDPNNGGGPQRTQVTVAGFVRTIRNQKQRSFVELGDGSTLYALQAVVSPSHAKGLGTGTAVVMSGLWAPAPPTSEEAYELRVDEIRILGPTDAEVYPIQKKYHTPEYLRTIPHLRLRIPLNALLARLRSECDFHLSKFFRDREFVRLQPPILTSSDCEGAGEVFTVTAASPVSPMSPPVSGPSEGDNPRPENLVKQRRDFFRAPKYLTVSSQLHLEAFVHEHKKVWSLSPTFRAEKSDTPRHLSEFWMLEAEIQTENLLDTIDLVEDMIRHLARQLRKSHIFTEIMSVQQTDAEVNELRERWDALDSIQIWPKITYTEAIKWLLSAVESGQAVFKIPPSWREGLQPEHERVIAREIGLGAPVFVTDYPREIKPFYMLRSNTHESRGGPATAACFDLLLPDICEVAGGSLREHRVESLLDSMHKHGLQKSSSREEVAPKHDSDMVPPNKAANLDWYVDLRRYGSVPHGGFGLGLDRLIGYITGIHNLRDVAPWPRWYGRCDC